jgi:hypothetical protein
MNLIGSLGVALARVRRTVDCRESDLAADKIVSHCRQLTAAHRSAQSRYSAHILPVTLNPS